MKYLVAALLGFAFANCAQAQEMIPLRDPPVPAVAPGANPRAVPPAPEGVQLVNMLRFYHAKDRNHWSGHEEPYGWTKNGWKLEGIVGYISYTPFAGSHALYNCFIAGGVDLFTSPDPNCEGKNLAEWMPILGYVASTQIPGTVPLYRCMRGYTATRADHFDTTSAACEDVPNKANDGIIGYIFI